MNMCLKLTGDVKLETYHQSMVKVYQVVSMVDMPKYGVKVGDLGGWLSSIDDIDEYSWVGEQSTIIRSKVINASVTQGSLIKDSTIENCSVVKSNVVESLVQNCIVYKSKVYYHCTMYRCKVESSDLYCVSSRCFTFKNVEYRSQTVPPPKVKEEQDEDGYW